MPRDRVTAKRREQPHWLPLGPGERVTPVFDFLGDALSLKAVSYTHLTLPTTSMV